VILNVKLDDEGEYMIAAKNPLGEASSMGRLKGVMSSTLYTVVSVVS